MFFLHLDDEVTSDGESQSADDEGIVGDSNDTISDSYARPHLADVTSRLMQQAEFSSPTVLSLTKILEVIDTLPRDTLLITQRESVVEVSHAGQ